MNAVLLAVVVMLVLAVLRVHVVLALFIGALVGGLTSGIGLDATMVAFQEGLAGGAKIALSYAMLGAFAMAVASSGLPKLLADFIMKKISGEEQSASKKAVAVTKWLMLMGILAMSVMSQNLIPVHIAFIPLIVPPLLSVMNKLRLDRRVVTCVLTFGLVTTYMWIPLGFGSIFLNEILLGNIRKAGMDTSGINIMQVMGIPALGMFVGLLIAVFFSYRKPRDYQTVVIVETDEEEKPVSRYKVIVSLVAIFATFAVQMVMQSLDTEADSLLIGALTGLAIFMLTGAVNWREADDVFSQGMKMMAMIGFIMITAQGFASVMSETGEVESLVDASAAMFGENKAAGALVMLLVGLVVTMGIGSSFSTLPIIATIYVPLCATMGFSPAATVAIIGAAGALGDAGSPASDSTLGPTAGLNADGQHDHIRDSVIPTFLHFNLPLIAAGWVAAMVL
ncbi:TRAP transporter large permease subunit [Corynebacterium diphtheriae bv. gravis]|uniref:Na+/H+ antiporter family protein n=1 Tax=Corynebacterium diphtheriae TaxID=1717 RepID=UPI000B4BA887|nr:Na+/H+ antiporter NhaC family protein [Corynebacterium diphtheriae]MBG9247720.1 TRAP transporter large permease subunit [Corynebacterium diphtheriae bv. gravis]MBG9289518.1 TRAP transporter large permease subunit [Corynebacterium diphtheriae bv. gravis]MBG9296038.1 TRAP transporter large permease subunit [Corynebacterium diphtheriae bv. gravis]OWN46303.1 sodium:proton antiporter [Corynebacterium diphtheriae bv. gravis]UJL49782.1 TRAP transporter large permease subunit [Corynebacterium dipht